jgi:hypothetical protein
MRAGLVTYLSDAISRVEGGGIASPSGSWLAGMFGKAANLFEKELSHFVAGLLQACRLRYPEDLGGAVSGMPPYEKLTLGQLVALIREAGKRRPSIVAKHIPGGRIPRFLDEVLKVNAAWVDTKHGEEIGAAVLLARMRTMLKLAKLLKEQAPADATPNQPMEPTGFGGGS